MAKIKFKEIDDAAKTYIELKKNSHISEEDNKVFKNYQQFFYTKVRYIVDAKVAKYKKFSNYPDLRQDGFEAVLVAFNSFKSSKGSFSYWANRYLKTRISRKANSHSTIKIPLNQIKNKKPFKLNELPLMHPVLITSETPFDEIKIIQTQNLVKEALMNLSEDYRCVISMKYGIDTRIRQTDEILNELSISKKEYNKIIRLANKQLKEILGKNHG